MDKRFVTFMLAVFGILFFFQTFVFKQPLIPPPASGPASQPAETTSAPSPASTPTSQAAAAPSSHPSSAPVEETGKLVKLQTESYAVTFNTKGAVPVSWVITDPAYAVKVQTTETSAPLEMVMPIEGAMDREYPLQFILKEAESSRGFFEAFNRRNYTLKQSVDGAGNTTLAFTSPLLPEGLQLTKTLTVPKRGFLCQYSVQLVNHSNQQMRFDDSGMGPGTDLGPGLGGDDAQASSRMRGAVPPAVVWLTPEETENVSSTAMKIGESRPEESTVRWAGITNRYFFAALIPSTPTAGLRVSVKPRNTEPDAKTGPQTVEVFQKPLTLRPGQSMRYDYHLFIGPKSNLELNSKTSQQFDLDKILFYSSWRWFRALCVALMWGLVKLRGGLPNYGWAIIVLTVLLRVLTQPFVYYSLKSNARFAQAQKKLKPEMDEIARKYKDNPQKKNEETWKLYKKHNVNPLGAMKGCFWMFLQMPFFFAFYRLLLMSIELRGAHFLWIADLSQPDHLFNLPSWFPMVQQFNLLPVLMTMTQFLTQKLTMTAATSDPAQKQMMYMMPLFFMFIMYNMSSGLVLYWFVSNLWQIGSQLWINKSVKQEEAAAAGAK